MPFLALLRERREGPAEGRWSPRPGVFPVPSEHQVTKGKDGREGKSGRTKGHDPCGPSKLSYDGSHRKYKMFNNLKPPLLIHTIFISGFTRVN